MIIPNIHKMKCETNQPKISLEKLLKKTRERWKKLLHFHRDFNIDPNNNSSECIYR